MIKSCKSPLFISSPQPSQTGVCHVSSAQSRGAAVRVACGSEEITMTTPKCQVGIAEALRHILLDARRCCLLPETVLCKVRIHRHAWTQRSQVPLTPEGFVSKSNDTSQRRKLSGTMIASRYRAPHKILRQRMSPEPWHPHKPNKP